MRRGFMSGGLILALTLQAHAVITADFPLKAVLKTVQQIIVVKVEKLDANPEAPRMVLKVEENLAGKVAFAKLPVNLLAGSTEGKKLKHTEAMLKRLEPGQPIVIFLNQVKTQQNAYCFTNGTWFHMQGKETGPGTYVWSFINCEPYLRRTFKGSTAELRQIVIDALAGKKEPPPTNPKEEPGLGPEVGEKKGQRNEDGGSRIGNRKSAIGNRKLILAMIPPFAVIPTVAVGGPLAILAMLFPALFGKPQDVMRRWLALLTVASILSMLYLIWWGDPVNLWLILAGVALAGAAFGYWRFRTLVASGYGESLRPSDGEAIVFRILSVGVLGLLAYGLGAGALLAPPFKEFVLMAAVVWAGTLGIAILNWQSKRDMEAPPGVPLETLMLSALALVCGGMAWSVTAPPAGPEVKASDLYALNWTFQPETGGRIDSTPLVTEERVYIAAAHTAGFSAYGTLYCLDRASGKMLWEFSDEGAMKQVFSSPTLVGERLFIGEGYHQHADCKLYCLNARTGEKVWDFTTMSHTESSPCVVDGKVYFGAGDDGVYCLHADTGKQVWHYQGLHVDTSPTVAHGRVFGGSGYGSRYYIFCLDAQSGAPIWREEWKLPVFGSPTVVGNQVYFGTGNGNMLQSDARPAGALLCVNADSGKLMWPAVEVPDSVLMKPAVDDKHVYFGSRDGTIYCHNRRDGKKVWDKQLGSPMVTAPLLAACPSCGHSSTLYAAASDGKIFCLDPENGADYWAYELPRQSRPQLLSSPQLFAGHGQRRLYFGAVLDHQGSTSGALYCLEDRYPWPENHGQPRGVVGE